MDAPMSETEDASGGVSPHPVEDPLPEFVDWILGALVALGGLLALLAGTALVTLVDRALLEESIDEEDVTAGTNDLTQAEAVDLAEAVVTWTGVGLLVVGIGMVAFSLWFVWRRHQAHGRAREGEPISSYLTHSLLGALTTTVLSFVPLSGILGGGLAGYLERSDTDRVVSVGALAGVVPVVPLIVFLTFVTVGLVDGLVGVGEGGSAAVVGLAMVFAIVLMGVFGAAIGALGGYLGGWVAENRADKHAVD